jgi:hypothetical protein
MAFSCCAQAERERAALTREKAELLEQLDALRREVRHAATCRANLRVPTWIVQHANRAACQRAAPATPEH